MIPQNILGRTINSAAIDEKALVTLDVVSVYLLQHLNETRMLDHMCFKGGISLRKVFARTPSRFSRDVDFVDASYQLAEEVSPEDYYLKLLEAFDGQNIHDILWRIKSLNDEELHGDSIRVDMHFFIYDDSPISGWEKRADNVLSFECSFRRPIMLPTQRRPLRVESWFDKLEFTPSTVPVLQTEEAIAEKIRAAFQRNNPRDIFDLYQYGQLTFDDELVRAICVMKCWQDRGLYDGPKNFNPHELLDKLTVENYSWERLRSQVSRHAWTEPAKLVRELRNRFSFLETLSPLEQELCDDRARKKNEVHDELWQECKERHDDRS